MLHEKKIPLGLKKVIERIAINKSPLFNYEFGGDFIINFKDSDPESDFYFKIKKVNSYNVNKQITYSVSYKPYSHETLESKLFYLKLNEIGKNFSQWLSYLEEYNLDSPIFDDVFAYTYYNNLEVDFTIVDDDSNFSPFSIQQQELILKFLDKAKAILGQEDKENEDVVNSLELIEETRSEISTSTKLKVIHGIRKFVALAYKVSIETGKKILIEFTTELAKKILLDK